ncbi:MAG: DDE-type integrase/transposase/recombinase [Nitrososphaerota archaeon]
MAVDETKLRVRDRLVCVWSAVDVDSSELLALEASYGNCLNALIFLMKALRLYLNKPEVIVDRGSMVSMALERLEYEPQRFGMRNRVERFFRHPKERTAVFHHKLSTRDHIQGIKNLNLSMIYRQTTRGGGD